MRHKHHRATLRQIGDNTINLLHKCVVNIRQWLIEHHYVWIGDDCPCEQRALQLAARQRAYHLTAESVDAHHLHCRLNLFTGGIGKFSAPVPAFSEQSRSHNLLHRYRKAVVDVAFLRQVSETQAVNFLIAVEIAHTSFRGRQQMEHRFQQRAFPATVRTCYRHKIAGIDFCAHIVKSAEIAEIHRNVFYRNYLILM